VARGVTVNVALLLAPEAVATTACEPAALAGTVKLAPEKPPPAAVDVVATVVPSYVIVTELEPGNPEPDTVVVEPTVPVDGESEIELDETVTWPVEAERAVQEW
jgi:hypothetical protein